MQIQSFFKSLGAKWPPHDRGLLLNVLHEIIHRIVYVHGKHPRYTKGKEFYGRMEVYERVEVG